LATVLELQLAERMDQMREALLASKWDCGMVWQWVDGKVRARA
jgi:hypothetical protein